MKKCTWNNCLIRYYYYSFFSCSFFLFTLFTWKYFAAQSNTNCLKLKAVIRSHLIGLKQVKPFLKFHLEKIIVSEIYLIHCTFVLESVPIEQAIHSRPLYTVHRLNSVPESTKKIFSLPHIIRLHDTSRYAVL